MLAIVTSPTTMLMDGVEEVQLLLKVQIQKLLIVHLSITLLLMVEQYISMQQD